MKSASVRLERFLVDKENEMSWLQGLPPSEGVSFRIIQVAQDIAILKAHSASVKRASGKPGPAAPPDEKANA
jgi:hypothetical protein